MLDVLVGRLTQDPPSVLLVAFALVGGATLFALPAALSGGWPYREVGHGALVLAAALATYRHLGLTSAAGVMLAGLVSGALLSREGSPAAEDPLGLPLRLPLAAFAATAALGLAVSRPLGSGEALDMNLIWYWIGLIGLLTLAAERDAVGAGWGAVLIASAVGLLLLHLLPAPPVALLVLAAAMPTALAVAASWLGGRPDVTRPGRT